MLTVRQERETCKGSSKAGNHKCIRRPKRTAKDLFLHMADEATTIIGPEFPKSSAIRAVWYFIFVLGVFRLSGAVRYEADDGAVPPHEASHLFQAMFVEVNARFTRFGTMPKRLNPST